MNFNAEELMLMMLYNTGSRLALLFRKIFANRKKVGLIESFHSCYTKTSFNAQKN